MVKDYTALRLKKAVALFVSSWMICFSAAGCSNSSDTATDTSSDASSTESSADEYTQYVTIGDYKNLTTDITLKEVTDEDIENLYNDILSQYPNIIDDPDGVVDEGDTVSLSYSATGSDNKNNIDGVVGGELLPSYVSNSIISHKVGDTVVSEPDGSGQTYDITINRIQKNGEITDDYVASLDIDGAKSIAQLKRNIKVYLKNENHDTYKESVEEDLISQIYNSSVFTKMPDELTKTFRDILQVRLDNVVYAYSLEGTEKTYDDILMDTYEKDGIDTVEEYLDVYSVQNARVYAICATIAQNEGIEPDITEIYSLAATDWATVENNYNTLADFLKDNGLETYRRATLMNTVKDYLFVEVTGDNGDEIGADVYDRLSESSGSDSSSEEATDAESSSADSSSN